MPSERQVVEEPWVDEMDGPERLARSKKKRAEQLERWEKRDSAEPEVKRVRKNNKKLEFVPNVVVLEAAARNDLKEVAQLLENGVSPDLANEDGLTALHQSCIDGCDDMVKYLVEHNANVNACDKEMWTPLHAAAACGHMSIVKYLLAHGGNILAINVDGNFPVDVIEDNEKVIKYLEKEMEKIGYGEEAIEELRQNQGKHLFDDLKDSVAKGRSLDIHDGRGATAFHIAAANGWTNIVDFLLENEADFEILDHDGWQPIHAAAAWGHDTILEILVASGADLDSKTNDSQTPLDLTEEDEIVELIEELKTKQVKYPRKGKGVRRRRSNTSNSSIKRSSIYEKNELSHADIKAEGAALLIQLQNTEESEATSPEELASPQPQMIDSHFAEQSSNSSREETGSSGYVSEASTDTKTDERLEPSEQPEKPLKNNTSDVTQNKTNDVKQKLNIANYLMDDEPETKTESAGNKEAKSAGNTIDTKTAPVAKPPRLAATTSPTTKGPGAYINADIQPVERPRSDASANVAKNGKENLKPSSEKPTTTKTELSGKPPPEKVNDGEMASKRNASTLSSTSEKRKTPERPQAPKSVTMPADMSQKTNRLKKGSRSSKGSSESSSKKSCTIL